MESFYEEYSVGEASRALGVSDRRVRAMIEDGVLAGRRSGGRWLIRRNEVEDRLRRRGRAGRPLSQRNAWALLSKLSGGEWPALPAWDRSRLQRKLAKGSLLSLASELRGRAEPRLFRADPRVLEQIRSDRAVVRSGVSAVVEYGVDLRAPGVLEAYVSRDQLAALVYRYALRPAAVADANLVLHLFDGSVPRTAEGVAPVAAVALDLLESGDARSQRAGRELARRRP
jgi:excisionase family DNA binding protein